MKVLIAVDESEFSAAALKAVASRPWPEPTAVLVYSVVEPSSPEFARWAESSAPLLAEAQKEILSERRSFVAIQASKLQDQLPQVAVDHAVVEGSVADSIVDKAQSWGADLIVLGSHGRTGFKRFLLGSVAESVASKAPCSVEIIRRPAPSAAPAD